MAGNENNIVTKMTVDAKAAVTNVEELNQALSRTLKNVEAAMAVMPNATKEFERLNLVRIKVEESIKTLKRVDEEGKVVRSRKIGTVTVEHSPQEKAAIAKEKADTEKAVREKKKLSAEEIAANEASLREKRRQRAEERQAEAAARPLTYPQMTRARRLSERLVKSGRLSAAAGMADVSTRGEFPAAVYQAEEALDAAKEQAAAEKAASAKAKAADAALISEGRTGAAERMSRGAFAKQAKKKILALEKFGMPGTEGIIAGLEQGLAGTFYGAGDVRLMRGQLIAGADQYLAERTMEQQLRAKAIERGKFLHGPAGQALYAKYPEMYQAAAQAHGEAITMQLGEEKPENRRALAALLARTEQQYGAAKHYATIALKEETEAKKKNKKKEEEGDKVKTEANKTEADATKRKKHRMTIDELEARRKEREAHPDVIARKEAAKAKKEADDAARKKIDDAKFEARQEIKEGRFGTITSALGTIGAVRAIGGGVKQFMEAIISGDPISPITGGLSLIGGIGQGISRYGTARMLAERTLAVTRATRDAVNAVGGGGGRGGGGGTPTGGETAGQAGGSFVEGAVSGGTAGAVTGAATGIGAPIMAVGGAVIGGLANLTSSAVKAGNEVVKLANARAQTYDIALGGLYQGSPLGGMRESDIKRLVMEKLEVSGATDAANFDRYIRAYGGNEQRYRMKREQMAAILSQPGVAMTPDEQSAAIASLTSAAGVSVPGELGLAPFKFSARGGITGSDVTAAISLGKLTNVSQETVGKYIGSFGRRTVARGPIGKENIVESLASLIGAANKAGLIGTGADALVNEFLSVADAANKRGVSFDMSKEQSFIQRLAAGGMSGAGLDKITKGYTDVTGGVLSLLTQGTAETLQGLILAQVGREPGIKTEGDIIRRVQSLTTEEKYAFLEKNVPELMPRVAAYFGMTEEEAKAAAARPERLTAEEKEAQAPKLVEQGALALSAAEAQLQTMQMLRAEYSTQLTAMKAFTDAVQDVTTGMRGWMMDFLPGY